MFAPIASPFDGTACPHDGTGEVTEVGRAAPGGGTIPFAIAVGQARQRRAANRDMAGSKLPPGPAEQPDQALARFDAADRRTRLTCPAAAIDLPRRNARDTDPGTLGAPDRPVPVPHRNRGAGEGPAGRDHGCRSLALGRQEVRKDESKQDLGRKPYHKAPPSQRSIRHDEASLLTSSWKPSSANLWLAHAVAAMAISAPLG